MHERTYILYNACPESPATIVQNINGAIIVDNIIIKCYFSDI